MTSPAVSLLNPAADTFEVSYEIIYNVSEKKQLAVLVLLTMIDIWDLTVERTA